MMDAKSVMKTIELWANETRAMAAAAAAAAASHGSIDDDNSSSSSSSSSSGTTSSLTQASDDDDDDSCNGGNGHGSSSMDVSASSYCLEDEVFLTPPALDEIGAWVEGWIDRQTEPNRDPNAFPFLQSTLAPFFLSLSQHQPPHTHPKTNAAAGRPQQQQQQHSHSSYPRYWLLWELVYDAFHGLRQLGAILHL